MNPGEPDSLSVFSPDYASARDRFRVAAASAGGRLEAHPIEARGRGGMELTVDAARLGPADADRLHVVSSGLHGVEGFFGSAVQLAWLGREGSGRGLGAGEGVLLI